MTPVEFRGDLWLQKTEVPGVSCGVVCAILRFAVLVEHRLVTDGHRHRLMASTADASRRAVIKHPTITIQKQGHIRSRKLFLKTTTFTTI